MRILDKYRDEAYDNLDVSAAARVAWQVEHLAEWGELDTKLDKYINKIGYDNTCRNDRLNRLISDHVAAELNVHDSMEQHMSVQRQAKEYLGLAN